MKLLVLAVSCFFIVTGILGIIAYDSTELGRAIGNLFGNRDQQVMALVVAIVQVIIGVFLLLELFGLLDFKAMSLIKIIFFILWAIFLVITYFIDNFAEPTFLKWLERFSRDLIILAALWLISQNEAA